LPLDGSRRAERPIERALPVYLAVGRGLILRRVSKASDNIGVRGRRTGAIG
jgi:hypothetical protein